MADTYLFGPRSSGADKYQENGKDDTAQQQSRLFQTLLQQVMQGSSMNNGSAFGAGLSGLTSGLNTYLTMQNQQQPYSTDPNSANFMGPPATSAG